MAEMNDIVPGVHSWDDVRQGEDHALDRLFHRWMPDVLQWCRRLGGPRVDPDQAAQEVFIVVLRRVHTVQNPGQLPSWLFSVTRRVLAQHRRRAWVRRWMPGGDSLEHQLGADPRDGPEKLVERDETIQHVQALLQQLPEELREVLVLCDMEQRTDPEAAAILGLKTGTAKSRLRRARQQFRALARAEGLAPNGGERA